MSADGEHADKSSPENAPHGLFCVMDPTARQGCPPPLEGASSLIHPNALGIDIAAKVEAFSLNVFVFVEEDIF